MTCTKKPLFLAEELARIARDSDPASWIADVPAQLDKLREIMPKAKRCELTGRVDSSGPIAILQLTTTRSFGGRDRFALYHATGVGLSFRAATTDKHEFPKAMADATLQTEQAFIAHFLEVIDAKLWITIERADQPLENNNTTGSVDGSAPA